MNSSLEAGLRDSCHLRHPQNPKSIFFINQLLIYRKFQSTKNLRKKDSVSFPFRLPSARQQTAPRLPESDLFVVKERGERREKRAVESFNEMHLVVGSTSPPTRLEQNKEKQNQQDLFWKMTKFSPK